MQKIYKKTTYYQLLLGFSLIINVYWIKTKKFTKQLIIGLIIISLNLTSTLVFSQSDTPCGTTALTLGSGACSYTTYNSSSATKAAGSENVANPSCCSFHYTSTLSEEDVWFSFVAPASGNVNLASDNPAGSGYDYGAILVYSGPCTGLTEIDCNHNYGSGTGPSLGLTGLTPGATYYVRVFGIKGSYSPTTDPKTYDFCAYEPSPPPVNDECSGAIPAVVNLDEYCTVSTPGTIAGATESPEINFCGGVTNADDDVWFSFVATNVTHYYYLENIVGPTTGLEMSIYSGTCGSLIGGICTIASTGLTVGDTYYVRVFSTGSVLEGTTFDLCITGPPIQPACAVNPPAGNTTCTATPICSLDGYCGNTSASYTVDVWPELLSAFHCGTIENNSFLSFTAASTSISFWVYTSNCNSAGIQIMVFEAANCSSGPVTTQGKRI